MTARKRPVVGAARGSASSPDARQLLEATFEAITEAMEVVDHTGRILRANTAFRALVGAPPHDTFFAAPLAERMQRLAIADAAGQPLPPERWPLARVLRGERVGSAHEPNVSIRTLDGRDVILLPSGSPLYDATGAISGGAIIYRDVTARRSAGEARVATMAQSEVERRRLATLLDVLPAGVAIFDAHGQLVEQNAASERITGYTVQPAEDAPIRRARSVMRGPNGAPLSEPETPAGRARRGETFADFACVISGPDGHDIHLLTSGAPLRDEHGAITGAVVVFQDVTARRDLERRTHASLEALLHMSQSAVQGSGDVKAVARQIAEVTREVLNCVRVGVTVIERETWFMRALAVVGLSSEEEAQLWAMQSENVRFDESGDPELAARLAAGELVVVDVTQPPYDQQPNPFGVTVALGVPMRLHGEFIGILSLDHAGERHVFSADELALAQGVADLAALVIERERLQAEATAAQAQALAFAETNARMNTFLGIAGHELRTPVTSIKSSVQLTARAVRQALDAALPDDLKGRMARAAHLLDGANDQADKLNRFITDLLDITHIQAGTLEMQPAAVDFAAVIRQGVAGVQPAWPQRTITLTIPTAPVMVWGDADRLGQVVTNLLTNALKYSPDAQPVEVQLTRAEATARLAVTDHGPGLSVEQQAQLFQPFGRATGIERQSGAGVGLGLGLFICKTIIERHQGAIGVTSQPGVGATFWCSLPLWERA